MTTASVLHQQIELFKTQTTALVAETICPDQPGRIKYQSSYWPARFYHSDCPLTVTPGNSVTVVGRLGITVLVVPENYLSPEDLRRLGSRPRSWLRSLWLRSLWGWWRKPSGDRAA
ncbi:NfeD family protein [Prochlorothrix hollandica]|uniref:NfeD family protein n=1 Tax=Prochlorothrix hollandica TaxID=1223 RepID=UPI00333E2045